MAILNQALYNLCLEQLISKIEDAKNQIEEIRESANDETKSSAGDKYETGREMMQQEINKASSRFFELQKMKAALDMITLPEQTKLVCQGNIVITNNGNYFLAVGLGALIYDKVLYHAISCAAPLAQKLFGLEKGASFALNSKTFFIEQII